MFSLFGKILNGRPNLLDLADAYLGLVQQNEMLVQVIIVVQNIAFGSSFGVTTSTTRFLNIVFE